MIVQRVFEGWFMGGLWCCWAIWAMHKRLVQGDDAGCGEFVHIPDLAHLNSFSPALLYHYVIT